MQRSGHGVYGGIACKFKLSSCRNVEKRICCWLYIALYSPAVCCNSVDAALASLALKEEDTRTQGTGGFTEDTCGNTSVWVGEQEAVSPGGMICSGSTTTPLPPALGRLEI